MLKKFDELTPEQQKRVSVMYSDQETVLQYLYNFDAQGNYHGRQYAPPVGVIHAEATEPKGKVMMEQVEVKEPVKNNYYGTIYFGTEAPEALEEKLEEKAKPKRAPRRTKKQ